MTLEQKIERMELFAKIYENYSTIDDEALRKEALEWASSRWQKSAETNYLTAHRAERGTQ